MALKSGLQLYTYQLTGTLATPVLYNLFNYVRDESVDMDRTEIDASSRASVTFRQFVPGLANGNVETQIMHLPGDPIFDAIQSAFFLNTTLLMAFVDGPLQAGDERHGETGTISVTGLWGCFYVTNFTEQRALEDAQVHDIRFSPTLEPVTNAVPDYKTVSVAL
tara:strand:+ start:558 stop:1049 length:492 start_codon:yes stop_codon:yes gene_type:complete